MASRFWAAGGSSSEEESDASEASDVEISQQQQARAASRWAVESDSESDDDTRVVKSAKDKALEGVDRACTQLKNHMKINDWTQIQTEFDALFKLVDKSKGSIKTSAGHHPKVLVRTMVALEDLMVEKLKNKAEQKKMSKENSKALIRMKGKLKKQLEPLQRELEAFRAHPESSSEEESESDSSDESSSDDSDSDSSASGSDSSEQSDEDASQEEESEEDGSSGESGSDDDDDDDDDDSWPSSESSSSESSEDEDMPKGKGRQFWLKQTPTETKAKKIKGPKQPKVRAEVKEETAAVQKPVEEELKLTPSQFDRRIKEIVAMRGKKGTELSEQLTTLRKLANYALRLGPARQLVATMYLVGSQMFDASGKIDRVMSARQWKQAHADLSSILMLLEQNPGFSIAPLTSEDQADMLKVAREVADAAAGVGTDGDKDEDEAADFVDTLPKAGSKGKIKVSGDLASFIERLSEEYTKALQQTDPHTSEYITRLFDEGLLLVAAERVQAYYERTHEFGRASTVALIRAELIYYKHESIAIALSEAQAKRAVFGDPLLLHPACNGATKIAVADFDASVVHPASISGVPTVDVPKVDTEKDLRELCLYVFKHADIRAKTRAMLCRIYHHAIHDRFHEARDLLLMSHIQDNITDADIATQILFNRMMAQLGLCAFRCGLIWEAHACLSEICTGARTKELLAQGMQSFRFQERDVEQERLERRRQVPYHMHINLDLLETCHLVSAMLLEVPNMVNSRVAERKRMVSKAFRKLLEYHERLVFEGPPESPRDHVVAAAKLLAQGSWRKCAELIVGLSVWDLIPGSGAPKRIREMVQHKVQVEALRTYLLAFSAEYDSVSLARLTEMFELDDKTVHSVVSKMMLNEELAGAWDQASQAIVLHKTERSSLQVAALQFADKLSQIVENNERMMDLRSGGGDFAGDRGRRGGDRGDRGDRGGNRGGDRGGNRGGDRRTGGGGFRPNGGQGRRGGGQGGARRPQRQ